MCFLSEALTELGTPSMLLVKELERYVTTLPLCHLLRGMSGSEDSAHAALSEEALELIGSDLLGDRGGEFVRGWLALFAEHCSLRSLEFSSIDVATVEQFGELSQTLDILAHDRDATVHLMNISWLRCLF